MCRDGLVIGAGANVGALLVDGLGDGVLLEAADQEFEFLRDTSFNLLQGCRMRNTKTVRSCFFFWFNDMAISICISSGQHIPLFAEL
jgi:hypothetical protein